MKTIFVKIYEVNEIYGIRILYENIDKQRRIIERETYQTFSSFDELKIFVNNIEIGKDYSKARIFVDIIFDKLIVENLSFDNEKSRNSKGLIQSRLEALYPNYILSNETHIENYYSQNKSRFAAIYMLEKNKIEIYESNFSTIGGKKTIINFDIIFLQNYLTKLHIGKSKKYYYFIQIENDFWRFIEVNSGKVVSYLTVYEGMKDFELLKREIFNSVDRRYDEIVIDSDFKTYISLSKGWQSLNVIYVDYSEKFKYLEERKMINYAS